MLRQLAIGALGVLAPFVFWLPSASGCSRLPFPSVRFAHATYFIAVPLSEFIDAGPNATTAPDMPAQLEAQLVRLERVGGANARNVLGAAKAARGKAVLVPWADAPDCTRVPPRNRTPWDVGERGFFAAVLRPESEWVRRMPTFDVHPADLQPYPYAEFFREGFKGTKVAGPSDLSVDQYWTLYEALPDFDERNRDPIKARRAIDKWRKIHPQWATRYPATEILPFATGE